MAEVGGAIRYNLLARCWHL